MKTRKILQAGVVLVCLLFAAPVLFAQTTNTNSGIQLLTASSTACATVSSCVVLQVSPDSAGLTVSISVNSGGSTVQFEGTVDGTNWFSVAGAPVASGSAVTSTTGTGLWQFNITGMNAFRARCSTFTAAGVIQLFIQTGAGTPIDSNSLGGLSSVNVTQIGGTAVNTSFPGGLTVVTGVCSGATCFSSPVNSGVTVIASGSTSTIFAVTTELDGLHCDNTNASAVTLTGTDGSNNYFIGPGFSMPGLSQYDAPPGMLGTIFASGIKMSAGTASSINCWVRGKQ